MFDPFDRVHHRRVVFASKGLADVHIRTIEKLFNQVHADLSRNDDRFGSRAGLQIADLDVEVIGHELLDLLDRDR